MAGVMDEMLVTENEIGDFCDMRPIAARHADRLITAKRRTCRGVHAQHKETEYFFDRIIAP